jgi:DNA-binding NarL/FixJ family response regulator
MRPLTRREQQVLELIAKGLSNKEIALKLFISDQTVKNHVSTILYKLGVKNRAQAAATFTRPPLFKRIQRFMSP